MGDSCFIESVEVLVTQSRPTLCDPMDCSPPESSVHGILQARILEWVAISFSNVLLPYAPSPPKFIWWKLNSHSDGIGR